MRDRELLLRFGLYLIDAGLVKTLSENTEDKRSITQLVDDYLNQ